MYDKLLPFYYGDPDQQFDLTNKVGAILVQGEERDSKPSQLLGDREDDILPIINSSIYILQYRISLNHLPLNRHDIFPPR